MTTVTTTTERHLRLTPRDVDLLVLALNVLEGDRDWHIDPALVGHARVLEQRLLATTQR